MSDARECDECRLWEAEQLENGEWDHFTVGQLRELRRVHHAGHSGVTYEDLLNLHPDATITLTAAELRSIVALATAPHDAFSVSVGSDRLSDDSDATIIARDLQPDPPKPKYVPEPAADGHDHIRTARQRCSPPAPGFVDVICHCNTIVSPHEPCPHPKQDNTGGRLTCAICDYAYVQSGVVGEGLEARDASWMPREHKDGSAVGRVPGVA